MGADRRNGSGARDHAIARGSAFECAACLDVRVLLGAARAEDAQQGKVIISRIVSMLSRMCR